MSLLLKMPVAFALVIAHRTLPCCDELLWISSNEKPASTAVSEWSAIEQLWIIIMPPKYFWLSQLLLVSAVAKVVNRLILLIGSNYWLSLKRKEWNKGEPAYVEREQLFRFLATLERNWCHNFSQVLQENTAVFASTSQTFQAHILELLSRLIRCVYPGFVGKWITIIEI